MSRTTKRVLIVLAILIVAVIAFLVLTTPTNVVKT